MGRIVKELSKRISAETEVLDTMLRKKEPTAEEEGARFIYQSYGYLNSWLLIKTCLSNSLNLEPAIFLCI